MKQLRLPTPRTSSSANSLRRKAAEMQKYQARDRRAMELMSEGLAWDDAYAAAFEEQRAAEFEAKPFTMRASG